MKLNAYLMFNGECEAAFKFYEQAVGAKIIYMSTYKETPMAQQMPPEFQDKIIHARCTMGNTELMGSDAPPGRYEAPKGFQISLDLPNPAETERIFHALSEGGTVTMPVQETFWAARFGMFTDKFGIPWMVNCDTPPSNAS